VSARSDTAGEHVAGIDRLEPMITKARAELAAVGIDDTPGVVVADVG
jgi:hypothetical protein